MISKDTKSSRKKESGKHKFFICNDRRHFAKVFSKSRNSKKVVKTLKEAMDSQFPAEDEALHDLYLDKDNILEFCFNTDKGTSEDVFIDSQPHPFISRQSCNASKCVKGN